MFSLTRRILLQSAAAAMVLGLAAGSAKAEDTIKIGVLATLEGAFTGTRARRHRDRPQ